MTFLARAGPVAAPYELGSLVPGPVCWGSWTAVWIAAGATLPEEKCLSTTFPGLDPFYMPSVACES